MSIQTQYEARLGNAEARYLQLKARTRLALDLSKEGGILALETALAARNKAENLLDFAALSCLPDCYVRDANKLVKEAAHLVVKLKRQTQH